jgi:hypothetical protein
VFVPLSPTRFSNADAGLTWEFAGDTATLTDRYGTVDKFERTAPVTPTLAELGALAGNYVNDEAELTLVAAVEEGRLVLKRRPNTTIVLTPLYRNAFSGSIGTVIFRPGNTMEMSVSQDRVWDLRFTRRAASVTTAQ